MILEVLGHLSAFQPVADYRYVGFGSPFFVDFHLIHRRLAIKSMISIEKEEDLEARFTFNVPFECVELKWGTAGDVLPSLVWDEASITWLDYDYRLKQSVLADMSIVADRAKHGDCLLVTVDADPPESDEEVEEIEKGLGSTGEPLGSPESLAGWVLAEYFYDLMHSLAVRAVRERGTNLEWIQLFRFHYRDSALMFTYGGVFVDPKRREEFNTAGFNAMEFVREEGEEPFLISMPRLTLKETAAIDKFMPGDLPKAIKTLEDLKVDKEHVERYARIYRHAPTFVESQV